MVTTVFHRTPAFFAGLARGALAPFVMPFASWSSSPAATAGRATAGDSGCMVMAAGLVGAGLSGAFGALLGEGADSCCPS